MLCITLGVGHVSNYGFCENAVRIFLTTIFQDLGIKRAIVYCTKLMRTHLVIFNQISGEESFHSPHTKHTLLLCSAGQGDLDQGVQCPGCPMSGDCVRGRPRAIPRPDGALQDRWQIPWHKLPVHGRLCRPWILLCRDCQFTCCTEGEWYLCVIVLVYSFPPMCTNWKSV